MAYTYQTIAQRKPAILKILGNRSDLDGGTPPTRLDNWCLAAYLELGMAYNFSDQEATNTSLVMTPGLDTYAYPNTTVNYPWRSARCITILNPTNNTQLWNLVRRNIQMIDRYTVNPSSQGMPVIYAPWGGYNIVVRPIPDQAYPMIWRGYNMPYPNSTVANTVLLMPLDWLEILDYSTALRGYTDLEQKDKAQTLFNQLHGCVDPRSGRLVPGWIAQKLQKQQQEFINEEYAIVPKNRGYSSAAKI